jgi:hypothetical protein
LEVLNGANAAILGDEIIQWKTATLLECGTYELSGLLRWRRGTEGAVGTHKLGERFVVLAADGMYRTPLPQTEIGRTAYYRAVQNGGEWDDAPTIPFAFAASSLKCFTPVKIKGSRDGSNNLTISWIRRTRWYGEWQDGIDVPLFEANERYEIDILSGSTVVRTLSTTTPSVIYTAANQTTDFGAPQSAVSIAIYQINAVIGRGHARMLHFNTPFLISFIKLSHRSNFNEWLSVVLKQFIVFDLIFGVTEESEFY